MRFNSLSRNHYYFLGRSVTVAHKILILAGEGSNPSVPTIRNVAQSGRVSIIINKLNNNSDQNICQFANIAIKNSIHLFSPNSKVLISGSLLIPYDKNMLMISGVNTLGA